MARSTDAPRARSSRLALIVVPALAIVVSACSDLPSKTEALDVVQQDVKEDGSCTLPIALLSRFKLQYTSKAICVPREGGPPMDAAMSCLDALAATGATKRMPARYMAEWPDEMSGVALTETSPYERRTRELLFKGCVEMAGNLREGRFRCGKARADKIVRITKNNDRALVRYSRAVTLDPQLEAIEKACGPVSRPPPEATATLEKADKRWVVAADEPHAAPSSP